MSEAKPEQGGAIPGNGKTLQELSVTVFGDKRTDYKGLLDRMKAQEQAHQEKVAADEARWQSKMKADEDNWRTVMAQLSALTGKSTLRKDITVALVAAVPPTLIAIATLTSVLYVISRGVAPGVVP